MSEQDQLRGFLSDRLVGVGEIAEIAEVGPSAVSNWRGRHPTFPLAAQKKPSGELFNLGQVVAWLKREGKRCKLTDKFVEEQLTRALWEWTNSVGFALRPSEYLELPLQLLCLRKTCQTARDKSIQQLWSTVVAASNDEQIHASVTDALRHLGEDRPLLELALEPVHTFERIDAVAVSDLVRLIDSLDLEHPSPIGQVVTNLIEDFGKRLRGELFFTPKSLRNLLIALLRPIEGRVYDPACGAALLLTEVWRARDANVKLFGQEINVNSWRLAALHLDLNDANADLGLPENTLVEDIHEHLRADRIVLDPPLNLDTRTISWLEGDERWQFGMPGKSGDLAWAQHLVWHLADTGIGVMVCAPGVLSHGGHEATIRRRLVEADVIDAVIQLPANILPATSLSPVVLVFDKQKANRSGKILFVDARKLGKPQRGGIHELEPDDVEKISSVLTEWRSEATGSVPLFAENAEVSDIEENQWKLSVQDYVNYAFTTVAIDGEPIVERFNRLQEEMKAEVYFTQEDLSMVYKNIQPGDAHEWPRRSLGNLLLGPPVTGVRHLPDGEGPTVPFVETGQVSQGRPVLDSAPSEVTIVVRENRLTTRGDLLLVSRGVDKAKGVGCSRVDFDESAAFSGSLVRLRVDPKQILADYLRLFLTSQQGLASLQVVATGTVITNLPKSALARVQVPVPELLTQERIVEVMTAVEEAVEGVDHISSLIHRQHDVLREGLVSGILEAKGSRG